MVEPKDRATLEEAEIAARQVGRMIEDVTPDGWGFTVLMFTYGGEEDGKMTYLSNCNRSDMIKALREFCDKAERGDPEL